MNSSVLDRRPISDANSDRPEWHRVVSNVYVLITAAHNEEKNIGQTIESVLAQTVRPRRWIIVSDNSTDQTDNIIREYANQYDFIQFQRVVRQPGRAFSSKVAALRLGVELVQGLTFDLIGNIDADITVDPTYFHDLISHCQQDPRLGIVGGNVLDRVKNSFRSRRTNDTSSVAHAAQLVRRECYEAIGGYAILRYGGEDWHAQTSARMKGWRVRSFPHLPIFHHRPTGTGNGSLLLHMFRQGRMDYSFGSYTPFELIKCLRRLRAQPLVLGGLARLAGFCWSSLCREKRLVPDNLAAFLRREQKKRISALFTKPSDNAAASCCGESKF